MNRFALFVFGLTTFTLGAQTVTIIVKHWAETPLGLAPYFLMFNCILTLIVGLILWSELDAS
jgi:hypothetical protein